MWRAHRHVPGVGHWAAGLPVMALGFALIALRDFVPDFLSIVVANVAIVAYFALLYEGLCRFDGAESSRGRRATYLFFGLALAAVLFAYSAIQPHFKLRVVAVSMLMAVGLVATAVRLLAKRPAPGDYGARILVSVPLAIIAVMIGVRAVETVIEPGVGNMFTPPARVPGLLLLIAIFWAACLFLGLSLMVSGRVEASSRKLGEQLETFLTHSSDLIFFKDRQQCFTHVSRSLVDLARLEPQQLIGKRADVFLGEAAAQQSAVDDRRVMETGSPLLDRLEGGGSLPWLMTNKHPWYDSKQQIIGLFGISRDVTRQRQDEEDLKEAQRQAEQASQAKSMFLAQMSHEIRTPLNGVIGVASLLTTTDLDQEQREYVKTIQSCGEHLLELINDVLDISKLGAGELTLASVDCDLRLLVEQSIEPLKLSARDKGIALRVEIHERVPQRITVDPTRLRQILTNLVSNAVKFTDAGSVSLRAELEGGPGDWIVIRVKDSGVGIAAENRDLIFQPFVQADSTITRRFGGTGLGLSITKQLIEMMGGAIGVVSELGQGSTFQVRLPCRPVSAPEAKEHSGGRVS
jgi:PAS domain S-box-containing protein